MGLPTLRIAQLIVWCGPSCSWLPHKRDVGSSQHRDVAGHQDLVRAHRAPQAHKRSVAPITRQSACIREAQPRARVRGGDGEQQCTVASGEIVSVNLPIPIAIHSKRTKEDTYFPGGVW